MARRIHDTRYSLAGALLFLVSACAVAPGGAGSESPSSAHATAEDDLKTGKLALVYRGDEEAGCPGCSEAVQRVLETSRYKFNVKFVGPKEELKVNDDTLARAVLYVQPGGHGTVSDGWGTVKDTAPAIRKFVKSGGRYLGICMGAYFAGKDPGFELLPGDTDQWIASKDAEIKTDADAVVLVKWRKKMRQMYFQDGPFFKIDESARDDVQVLATYTSNGAPAALVAPFGKGKVGVVGPHPEADGTWYRLANISDADGPDADLAHDLIEATMKD